MQSQDVSARWQWANTAIKLTNIIRQERIMQATTILNCHVARQYPAPDPHSEIRCETCGLNAFDVAFVAAQMPVQQAKFFCCAAKVAVCRS